MPRMRRRKDSAAEQQADSRPAGAELAPREPEQRLSQRAAGPRERLLPPRCPIKQGLTLEIVYHGITLHVIHTPGIWVDTPQWGVRGWGLPSEEFFCLLGYACLDKPLALAPPHPSVQLRLEQDRASHIQAIPALGCGSPHSLVTML
ncbi:unnamed protein product [Boreogadus saida]